MHVITAEGKDRNELLVSAGLARIYGTRTPLPDGRDSREYLAHLRELESEEGCETRRLGQGEHVEYWEIDCVVAPKRAAAKSASPAQLAVRGRVFRLILGC
jgi:hypothetical protein